MNVPWEEFDLSALTYPQFLAFFFDRTIIGRDDKFELFRSGIDSFVASEPATMVAHIQAMCRDFAELTKVYSHEQLDQGLWAAFGAGISCERFLFDTTVDPRLRIDAIESMYFPFRDVVARTTADVRESFYWMWWDMILHTFWGMDDYDYSALEGDRERMAETMYKTLSRILALDHRGCQLCALHGLGHLHHPLVGDTVQSYLNAHGIECESEDMKWVESCRDGSIL